MQKKMNFRRANGTFLVAVVFLLGGVACNKQALAPHNGVPKTSTDLVVGPPTIIAWLKGPIIPVAEGIAYGRVWPFSFSIGGKGYMGAGVGYATVGGAVGGTDVWQYDPSTLSWTQVADWPGAAHIRSANFVIGSSGYVCTGSKFPATFDPDEGFVREVWQYDQTSNKWTKKNNFPGGARLGAVGAAINGKGYLGTGLTASSGVSQDWWQYDPASDGWVQKASLPGSKRTDAVAFAPPGANGKVYISTGQDAAVEGNYLNDLWAYNPATDNWAKRADLPAGGRCEAVGISLPATGVVSTGFDGFCDACAFNDCWQYSPATGAWSQLPNVGGGLRFDAGSFSIGNVIYIGAGQGPVGSNKGPQNDFWGLNLN